VHPMAPQDEAAAAGEDHLAGGVRGPEGFRSDPGPQA
jgi:cell division protease FtsH